MKKNTKVKNITYGELREICDNLLKASFDKVVAPKLIKSINMADHLLRKYKK